MKSKPVEEDAVREHVFDGIQEYDKRLPNWWLKTLYGTILFSIGYWIYYEYPRTSQPDGPAVEAEMARIALVAQESGASLTDEQLWTMSKDAKIVAAGKEAYMASCASCHSDDLNGKIGPNLKDHRWRHGGKPTEVLRTIAEGVPSKGMPAWAPVLGRAKVAEIAAFVMSHHQPDEPIEVEEVAQ